MSPTLRPCSQCFRHILVTEESCPFCDAPSLAPGGRARSASKGRMSRAALVALGAGTIALSCGGKAEEQRGSGDGDLEGIGGTDESGGAPGVGGVATSGGAPGAGGMGDVVAPPYGAPPETGGASFGSGGAPSYRPVTEVDFAGDGHFIDGGSVEGGRGDGFDTCITRNPGASVVEDAPEGVAADGTSFLSFTPTEGDSQPDPEGAEAQAAFINDEVPLPVGTPIYVYFEIRNLSDVAPVGELSLAPVDYSCEPQEAATTIPLIALEPGPGWETRCVTLVPEQEQNWLGIWITGQEFAIGIDALRLGPPCN
jgi:hypothetical protein